MLKYSAQFSDGHSLIVFQPLDSDCFTTWSYLEDLGYNPIAVVRLDHDYGPTLSRFCG